MTNEYSTAVASHAINFCIQNISQVRPVTTNLHASTFYDIKIT